MTELTMDRRPRKRPRLGWDVLPQGPQVIFRSDLRIRYFSGFFFLFFCRSDGKLLFIWDQV